MYLANEKNYLNISTDIDNKKIIVTCFKINGQRDRITINLKKYKKLQKGYDVNPIKVKRLI